MVHFYWIPEAPDFPGLYAASKGTSTRNPNAARKFDTKEECALWCETNPHPVFVPQEHGFCTGLEDFG